LIFDVLVQHELTASVMARAIVSQFAESSSYNDARRNMGLVERVKTWSPQLLTELEQARAKNHEISDAFGVPRRIEAIIEQHSR
jgi:hypothetical protein